MKNQTSSIKILLETVPREPGTTIPPGSTTEDIDAFQLQLGYAIPSDLRTWLQISNGPCVGAGGLFGIGAVPQHLSIHYHMSLHPEWKIKKWLPIAGDGCGNYYLLVTAHDFCEGFPVVFVESITGATSPAYVAASDIWHFLHFMLLKELAKSSWPFNMTEVVAQDPEILRVTGVPLPWHA